MSTELIAPYITAKTAYAIIRDTTGQAWNTSGTPALEAWQDAHWSVYAISTPEQGTASAGYVFTVPALPAGAYSVTWHEQQGGSPAIGDADYAFASDEIAWDGSALIPLTRLDASVSSRLATSGYTAPDNAGISSIETSVAALPSASAIVSAIQSAVVEGAITQLEADRIMLAASAGKLSGAATTTVSIRDTGDTKDRIVATVDPNGNRTAVTLDGS